MTEDEPKTEEECQDIQDNLKQKSLKEEAMTEYTIKVEIPDGPYCADMNDPKSFCQYQGDAHYGSGLCALITKGDNIIYWEGKDKFERVIKHPLCPSLKPK